MRDKSTLLRLRRKGYTGDTFPISLEGTPARSSYIYVNTSAEHNIRGVKTHVRCTDIFIDWGFLLRMFFSQLETGAMDKHSHSK